MRNSDAVTLTEIENVVESTISHLFLVGDQCVRETDISAVRNCIGKFFDKLSGKPRNTQLVAAHVLYLNRTFLTGKEMRHYTGSDLDQLLQRCVHAFICTLTAGQRQSIREEERDEACACLAKYIEETLVETELVKVMSSVVIDRIMWKRHWYLNRS